MPDINNLTNNIEGSINKAEKIQEAASLEKVSLPEKALEKGNFKEKRKIILNEIEAADTAERKSAARSIISTQAQKKKQVEKILEEGLGDLYLSMPSYKQREFKDVGEKTAEQITIILDSAKFKIKKIILLIMKWLSLIPGVSKYFLEQEAKIKADEIIKLRSDLE